MSNANTTNPRQPQPLTAKEVIAANVKALIEQLEAGHSGALTAYLNAMSRFHNYSLGNILEIARQRPEATRVAGLYAWNQLGRKVKRGERGIRILAPIIGVRRKRDDQAEQDITKQNTRALLGFRNAACPHWLSHTTASRTAMPCATRRFASSLASRVDRT